MELVGLLALYVLLCIALIDATEAKLEKFLREMEPLL